MKILTILCLVLLSSYSYSQEVVTGTVETYYENGQLSIRGNYIDGERDGLWEWFRENGQLWVKANYTDGEQDGLSELFDEDGNLTKTETWENGEVVEYNLNP